MSNREGDSLIYSHSHFSFFLQFFIHFFLFLFLLEYKKAASNLMRSLTIFFSVYFEDYFFNLLVFRALLLFFFNKFFISHLRIKKKRNVGDENERKTVEGQMRIFFRPKIL